MPTTGFLTNPTASNAIDTTYTLADGIALTNVDASGVGITAAPGAETPLPQGVYLDHLEIRGVQTGAVASLSVWLSWDAAGDQPATSEGTINLVAGMTTANVVGGTVAIDAWVRPPGQTLTLYLWVKTNANAITIPQYGVRLHWTNSFYRVS